MTTRPNILFIMSDQHRADALGCLTSWFHTPNLDKLAGEGAHLQNLFAQSPVCIPSRRNFITGRYPHSHRSLMPNDEPHIFRVFKEAGYYIGAFGKNHMIADDDLGGFDDVAFQWNSHRDDPIEWREHLKGCKDRMQETGCWAGACWHDFPEELSSTHRIAESALSFLEKVPDDQPFFAWVSFTDPHAPHTAPRRFNKYYPEREIPLPPESIVGEELEEIKTKASRMAIKRRAQGMVGAPEEGVRRYRAVYGGMVSFVDEKIGVILDRLEERGLAENTLVLYTADHGDFLGDHGMVKKDLVLYDCILNIPGLIRWPGKIPPSRPTALVEQIDIMPTLLDACEIKHPPAIQGKSALPLLTGKIDTHRAAIHAESCASNNQNPFGTYEEFISEWRASRHQDDHPLRWTCSFNVPGDYTKAIRTETHKYIWYITGEEELYDLEKDPKEIINLAANPEHRELCAVFQQKLFEWHVRTEDPMRQGDCRKIDSKYPW